jgi:hypothetical protein
VTLDQDAFEAAALTPTSGRLESFIRASAATLPGPGYASEAVQVLTTYAPGLVVHVDSCSAPAVARECG